MNGLWKGLMILLRYAYAIGAPQVMGNNPHAPQKLTWQVISEVGEIVWSISKIAPPYTWWPTLTTDFCQLAAGVNYWDIPDADPLQLPLDAGRRFVPGEMFGCGNPERRCKLAKLDFYVCPRDGQIGPRLDVVEVQKAGTVQPEDMRLREMLIGTPVPLVIGS